MQKSFHNLKPSFLFILLFISFFQLSAQDTFTGNVFLDHNKDGIKNFSDYNHPVINIKVYDDTNGDGIFNTGDLIIRSDLTNVNGNYSLNGSGGSIRDSIFVQTGSDDAEERVSSGSMGLTSTDMEMADENGSNRQKVGIRFDGIAIPAGAIIRNAFIRFEAKQTLSSSCNLNITAEKSIASPTFTTTSADITNRDTTTASIPWSPGNWTDNSFYKTPDLTNIVSELVIQSGWGNSSAVTFIITGEGEREAWSENGSGAAPELVVEYDTVVYTRTKYHIVLEESELASGSELSIPASSNYYTYDTGLGATANLDFAFQGEVVLCYAMSDGNADSGLSAMNRMTGEDLLIGIATGANRVEASCFHPITSEYYAADENQLGIVNTNTGAFTATSNTFGTGGHSTLANVAFDDVDGLAFDPLNGELWGTHRRGGSRDLLIKINPSTGAHIPEAFGTNNDYVVVTDAGGLLPLDIDDIAIDPDTRKLYGIANESGLDILVEIDFQTGIAISIDTLQYANGTNVGDVEGFGFTNYGLLLAITGNTSSKDDTKFTVDLNTAIVTEVGTYDYGTDYESCDCLTAAANNFSGNVWNDIDGDQLIDVGEDGLSGATIYLYNDLNNNGKIEGTDILFDSTDTNGSGYWSYSSGSNVNFIFAIDINDLPGGTLMTTNNLEYARFGEEIGGATDDNNNFGYNTSGPDSDHDGIFDSSDADDDNDGIPDVIENYALDSDGDGVADPLDLDSDNDGIPDLIEAGGVDLDGDGRIDDYTDMDGDGLMGVYDNDDNNISTITSTLVPGGNVIDTDLDGLADYIDLDADNDGIPDLVEVGGIDTDGNGLVDITLDDDGDGFSDIYDSDEDDIAGDEDLGTPIVETDGTGKMLDGATSLDKDNDNDGFPDHLDLDADNDGIPDIIEAGGISPNSDGMVDILAAPWDSDNDGLADLYDENNSGTALIETTADANNDQRVNNSESMTAGSTNQINIDDDAYPNHLDLDADNDGITDVVENASGAVTADDSSGSLDGIVGDNPLVTDTDNDGWHDPSNTSTTDTDGDGLPDFLDIDADNDGIVDYLEGVCSTCPTFTSPTGSDSNGNGVLDMYENLTSANANAGSNIGTTPNEDDDDGTNPPDYLDTDSDEDGAYDWTEGYDLNNDGKASDDIILMAADFEAANSLGYYNTTDTDSDGIPDWLDNQPSVAGYDENTRPPFLDQNTSYWKDDNSDGLVALFDANENGTPAPTPDNNAGNDNDWRDMTALVSLPVELTRFDGLEVNCEVKLTWHAASEEKFNYYEVQWSEDGYDFQKVIILNGKGGANQAYSFIHKNASTHNYYRLIMVDLDGSMDYSKVIYVKSDCEIDDSINLYPNPINEEMSQLNLEFKPKDIITEIIIFDMVGYVVKNLTLDTEVGQKTNVQFDISNLPSGTYTLIITGEPKSNRFIISK